MRGSMNDRFGFVRGDALGVNPAGDAPVIATPVVEDETESKSENAMEIDGAKASKESISDAEEASAESDRPEEEKKPRSKIVARENASDAEEDNTESLPPVQQQLPLQPKPRKEAARKPPPQDRTGSRAPVQTAGLTASDLATAMSRNQNLLPVAPNMPMGWAALAAFPQGLPRTQIPEAPPQPSPLSGPQTLLYTVGFGIDPRQTMHSNWDATEAAVRALRDAMERSTVRLPPNASGNVHESPFQIHVKLGVPPRADVVTRMQPMVVDMNRIASVLPRSIPILPVDVVVGGLSVSGKDDPDVSICTAVACVTVQTNANTQRHAWERAAVAAVQQQQQQIQATMDASPWQSQNLEQQQRDGASAATMGSRVDSMEMLARISEEVRERPFALGAVGDRLRPDEASQNGGSSPTRNEQPGSGNSKGSPEEESTQPYKKLPDGFTAKRNKRQFVQHCYHDHSLEKAPPMSQSPMYSARGKTVGTAFPVKLHDLLSEIERDGYAYIISWLPHGRCFKIHKQQEFLDIILPNYFVMTKKSSFLRQLNLYGFNRLSAGHDKGAYYHELFLRGMRFLCKRMIRMKVNGNGIRAAGNPDMEPDFYKMPSVPRDALSTQEEDEEQDQDHEELEEEEEEEEDDDEEEQAPAKKVPDDKEPHKIEHVLIPSTDESPKPVPNFGGNNQASFPLKLQSMLDKLEADENTDIVSWLPHGRAFIVHKPDEFVKDLMPAYFRQTKYSSFQRQLHMYSFQRITAGKDKGAYFHESFLRGKPHLSQKMVRTRINGKGCRQPGDPSNEPNFHSMKPMDAIQAGSVVEIPMDVTGRASPSDGEEE